MVAKIDEIVGALEADAITVANLVQEAERKAEQERREWESRAERWRQEQAETQRLENLKKSRDSLFALIDEWGTAMRVDAFFREVENSVAELSEGERGAIRDRAVRARELLGSVDALKKLLTWRAPEEL